MIEKHWLLLIAVAAMLAMAACSAATDLQQAPTHSLLPSVAVQAGETRGYRKQTSLPEMGGSFCMSVQDSTDSVRYRTSSLRTYSHQLSYLATLPRMTS